FELGLDRLAERVGPAVRRVEGENGQVVGNVELESRHEESSTRGPDETPNAWRAAPRGFWRCRDRRRKGYGRSWFVIVGSVILASSASRNALLRMIDSVASPSNGSSTRSSVAVVCFGTMHRYWSLGAIRMLPLPR